ncbi:MAG: hypothetical protein E6Z15_06135, partial [Paenibacillus macerans]|nr:hypothetical protein [Paenibacillus macerans]
FRERWGGLERELNAAAQAAQTAARRNAQERLQAALKKRPAGGQQSSGWQPAGQASVQKEGHTYDG